MAATIEVERLTVERGGKRVLDNLSFTVPRGSITGLLGPSGSGKTTLMRAIVGIQRVRSGRVMVLEEPAGSPAIVRRVGYVTQAPSVYADLTIRENTHYFGSLYGVPAREAERWIDDVGLSGMAGRLVSTLSGGQRARASLACTLLSRPEVLILDEPTVGQDPVLRRDLWNRFRALASQGTTLLVSSHVMEEANSCDRLILLRDGRLIADSTPAEVRTTTGTEDLSEAFLRLVLASEKAAPA